MKQRLRKAYHFCAAILFFIYDLRRCVRYSGFRYGARNWVVRNYYAVLVYHALEKSLSFRVRNPKSGWANAFRLLDVLKDAETYGHIGFHDKAGREVLERFLDLPENRNTENAKKIKGELTSLNFVAMEPHGTMAFSKADFHRGKLAVPEDFFFSRYSLREFQQGSVSTKEIERAVQLALKTPSVCNRQPWNIYHTSDENVRDIVLQYQSGNRPFGKNVPNLIVVTTDLQAFFGSQEHYQHWIDGGMFSMSLLYAFHSLGIAACALNWSQTPKNDRALRKLVNIDPHHTIIMAIAVGYPNDDNKVCVSARVPLREKLKTLEKRK